MAHHDRSYKLLFSHPRMVRDLLEGFVCKDKQWGLDYDSLEKVSADSVSDTLRARSNDLVWRVRHRAECVYLYLVLEFQSTIERFMAVRVHTYVGHLYQDLIRAQQLAGKDRVPEVLPIVLYNGERVWRAPRDLASLIERGSWPLEHYRPHVRYLLIDERRVRTNERGSSKNLAAVLFQIENSKTEQELRTIVGSLRELLRGPQHAELRRAFSVWISEVILPRVRGTPSRSIEDLEETYSMLSETIKKWKADWRREGLREGRTEGRMEGRMEGRLKGRQEGHRRGRLEGRRQGLATGRLEGRRQGLATGRREGRDIGRREGAATLLLQLLRARFGRVPAEVRQRLAEASTVQLKQWSRQLLNAQQLEDVFKEAARRQ